MTDVTQEIKKTVAKKSAKNPTKSDETLLKDAKQRIMSLQVYNFSLNFLITTAYIFLNCRRKLKRVIRME